MLVGYVSDERYVALPDVLLEFESEAGSVEARSRASGAVYAGVMPGTYRVTLAKEGFGGKRVQIVVRDGEPYQFRLLSDGLLGYAWPKWVRAGEASEFRVHSPEAYKLTLWRYGCEKEFVRTIGWFDEHGPRDPHPPRRPGQRLRDQPGSRELGGQVVRPRQLESGSSGPRTGRSTGACASTP